MRADRIDGEDLTTHVEERHGLVKRAHDHHPGSGRQVGEPGDLGEVRHETDPFRHERRPFRSTRTSKGWGYRAPIRGHLRLLRAAPETGGPTLLSHQAVVNRTLVLDRRCRPFAGDGASASCAVFTGGLADEAAAQEKAEGEMRWALYRDALLRLLRSG